MSEVILTASKKEFSTMPKEDWERAVLSAPERTRSRYDFMSADHHRVRNFVVREMPAFGEPIPPRSISERLMLPLKRVLEILAELERGLFFLTRNSEGSVAWAYPVTVEPTSHALSFSSGERLYAA